MKRTSALIIVAGIAAASQAINAADISGKITLKGTPPAEAQIDQSADPNCGKNRTAKATTHHYVVGSSGELANVVVSLQGISGKSAGASEAPAVVDQKGCEYIPSIL